MPPPGAAECRPADAAAHEREQLERHQALAAGRDPDAEQPAESEECAEFRRQRAAFQAQAAEDAEAAFEQRKAELQSVDDAEYFEGRVNARMARGQTFTDAVIGANEDLSHRNVTSADGRSAGAFAAKVGCD